MINTMEINPEELPALDLFQNCRLCLANEKVSVDIFSEGHEIRLLYYKIVSCLPVNVTQEDKLPRKICTQCNQKVDDFYQFWTLTAKSQKTLLEWVEKRELLPPTKIKMENDVPGQVSFKQEAMDYSDDDNNELDRYDDDNSEEENNLQPTSMVKVCEEGDEASGAPAGPSTVNIKSSLEIKSTLSKTKRSKGKFRKADHATALTEGHLDRILPNGVIKCGKCNRLFPNEDKLAKHKAANHSKQSFKCHICGKLFGLERYLKRHFVSHNEAKPFDCNLCEAKLKTKYLLKNHVRIVHYGIKNTVKKIYKCTFCQKLFATFKYLQDHQYVHTGQKSYVCNICGASFAVEVGLKTHRKYIHDGFKRKKETLHCELCGKSYNSRAGFNMHKRSAHGDAKPECHFCGKKFSSKEFLRIHINIHTGEKPFCCEYCGSSFASDKTLVIHVRSHTGEAPFGCSICSKFFKQRSARTQHYKRNHPGEQPKRAQANYDK